MKSSKKAEIHIDREEVLDIINIAINWEAGGMRAVVEHTQTVRSRQRIAAKLACLRKGNYK